MLAAPDLDSLLLRYLTTLETYQTQIEQLSQSLADGFLHLAEANYHAPPGKRYGRDWYDLRMKAVNGVEVVVGEEGVVEWGVRKLGGVEEEEEEEEDAEDAEEEGTVRRRKGRVGVRSRSPSKSETTESEVADESESLSSKTESVKNKKEEIDDPSTKTPIDLLRMFTPLPPASLRAAQTSFTHALPLLTTLLTTLSHLTHLTANLHIYKLLPQRPYLPLPRTLPLSQLDTDSGYIHLCAAGQIRGVVNRFMQDAEEVWVLRIPMVRVRERVRWEEVGDVEKEVFPHLYAELERGMVDAVGKWGGDIGDVRWVEVEEER